MATVWKYPMIEIKAVIHVVRRLFRSRSHTKVAHKLIGIPTVTLNICRSTIVTGTTVGDK